VDIIVYGGDESATLAIDDRESTLVKNSTVTDNIVTGMLGNSSIRIVRLFLDPGLAR